MKVLGNPGVGTVILMVHTVHVFVQGTHAVMQPVPSKVFRVEYQ
jgi:hypothetical protein